MAWCPKCNEIYDDGVNICTVCNEPLLHGVPDDYTEILNNTDEEFALTTFNRLVEDGFDNAQYYLDENGYHILIDKFSEEDVLIAINTLSGTQSAVEEDTNVKSSPYVKKSDKYNDYKSSAISLLVVGIPGLIITLIDILGIVNLIFFNKNDNFLFGILMIVLFSVFILSGIYSIHKIRRIKPLIEKEERLTEDIKRYIDETFDPAATDALIMSQNQNNNDLTMYYERCALLKQMIKEKFDTDDESYLDYIIEDLYSKYYESR